MTEYRDKTIRVSSLRLDLRNPRLGDAVTSQAEAVAAMLKGRSGNEIVALARSIAEQGSLDPSQRIVVVVEDGAKVVREGNRRVTALKLLDSPSLCPDERIRKQLERIASGATSVPDHVKAVVYDTREDYDEFLRLRHTGENAGAGLKRWNSAETARFQERQSGKGGIHTALLRWAEQGYQGDQEMLDLIRDVRDEKLTTLKRFLMVKIRPDLGLQYAEGTLRVEYTPEELRPFLARLFTDLVHGRTKQNQPWSRANWDDVKDYVRNQHHDLRPDPAAKDPSKVTTAPPLPPAPQPATAPAAPSTPGTTRTQDAQGGTQEVRQEGGKDKSAIGPAPLGGPALEGADTRLFPGVAFNKFGSKVNALGRQAQKISISANPEVCGVLCRVVVDLACTEFLRRHQRKPKKGNELWRRITTSIKILDPKADSDKPGLPELRRAWRQSDSGSHGLAVDRMNDFVHHAIGRHGADEVQALNEVYTPLLLTMEANLSQGVATGAGNGHP